MHIDWECPYCNEKHISRIKNLEVGDNLYLECTDCNMTSKLLVIQKKYILTYEQSSTKHAIAWE